MKRSEMVDKLSSLIAILKLANTDIPRSANQILEVIESCGMLPPARVKATMKPSIKVSKIDKHEGVACYTVEELYEILPVNEWEPE